MTVLSEHALLKEALAMLQALPGVQAVDLVVPEAPSGHTGDALLELATKAGTHRYVVEVKSRLVPGTLEAVLSQLQGAAAGAQATPLLVTAHVSDRLIDELLARGVEFVDGAGNVHLKLPDCFVLVRGNKAPSLPATATFTPAGLKVIYALLGFPELRKKSYRDIAAFTGVGLGSVARTVKGLLERGYLIEVNGTLHLADFASLFARWELGYLETLRPRLNPSTWQLTSVDRAGVMTALKDHPDVLIGGEQAAAALTSYLRPETLTLHVPLSARRSLVQELRALPVEGPGELTLLEPLSTHDRYDAGGKGYTHPLLVRAELLALGGDRLFEVADKLREDLILPEFARA